MSWTTPVDLKAEVQGLWDKGEILRATVSGESLFPRRMKFRRPTSAEIARDFDGVRRWATGLSDVRRFRVEWSVKAHRVFGANRLPAEVWLDSADEAIALIGRQREAAVFDGLVRVTRERQPGLVGWMAKKPIRVLDLADEWIRLLDVVGWLEGHPRPGVYLRQVDVPGVDSKFIEGHRGVLSEWLDEVLPPECVFREATGVKGFCRRYGFREKPERIRFRFLDTKLRILSGTKLEDVTLDTAGFAELHPGVSRVFITENETNFLAFPGLEKAMVIFGAGYGFEMLAQVDWLRTCDLFYWGDIDTHGFAILDQLRSRFPEVESILMDRETLEAFESHWGQEEAPIIRDLPRLRPQESEVYDLLRDNRIRRNLRLEQERIGFGWVQKQLAKIVSG